MTAADKMDCGRCQSVNGDEGELTLSLSFDKRVHAVGSGRAGDPLCIALDPRWGKAVVSESQKGQTGFK